MDMTFKKYEITEHCVITLDSTDTESTKHSLEAQLAALKEQKKERVREERRLRDVENLRLRNLFKYDLFEDLGIQDHPKRENLFALAWQMSHSEGYEAVYQTAIELSDLLAEE